jgi:hypothetical protein
VDSLEQGMYHEIGNWIDGQTRPNEKRVYNRCPVCQQTWNSTGLFSRENHLAWCWVPLFRKAAQPRVKSDTANAQARLGL